MSGESGGGIKYKLLSTENLFNSSYSQGMKKEAMELEYKDINTTNGSLKSGKSKGTEDSESDLTKYLLLSFKNSESDSNNHSEGNASQNLFISNQRSNRKSMGGGKDGEGGMLNLFSQSGMTPSISESESGVPSTVPSLRHSKSKELPSGSSSKSDDASSQPRRRSLRPPLHLHEEIIDSVETESRDHVGMSLRFLYQKAILFLKGLGT